MWVCEYALWGKEEMMEVLPLPLSHLLIAFEDMGGTTDADWLYPI